MQRVGSKNPCSCDRSNLLTMRTSFGANHTMTEHLKLMEITILLKCLTFVDTISIFKMYVT